MRGSSHYLIVYDISSDRERNRVDRVLKGFGMRLQLSVYDCWLSRRELETLTAMLEKLSVRTGFVRIYLIAANSRILHIGAQEARLDEDAVAHIV